MEYQISAQAAALLLDIFYWEDDQGRLFTSEAHINDVIANYGTYAGVNLSSLNSATVIANSQTGTVSNPIEPNTTIFAAAVTDPAGNLVEGFGVTVSPGITGFYNYTFDNPRPDTNYTVIVNARENGGGGFTDYTAYLGSKTTTGFQIKTVTGDNGGTQDSVVNVNHALMVIGTTSFGVI